MSLLNPVKEWAQKEFAIAETKLKAIDADHDGLPDLAEAKKLFDEGVTEVQVLEAKVTPAEIAQLLNSFFPGKFNAAEIAAGEAGLGKIVSAVQHLEGVAPVAGTALG